MFDDHAFKSWPLIIGGALLFGGLFGVVALLSEVVFEGALRLTSSVVGLSLAAFIGYLGTAFILRRGSGEGKD